MNDWFTINEIDKDTYVISEYRLCLSNENVSKRAPKK